jgi:hypothetical protein
VSNTWRELISGVRQIFVPGAQSEPDQQAFETKDGTGCRSAEAYFRAQHFPMFPTPPHAPLRPVSADWQRPRHCLAIDVPTSHNLIPFALWSKRESGGLKEGT